MTLPCTDIPLPEHFTQDLISKIMQRPFPANRGCECKKRQNSQWNNVQHRTTLLCEWKIQYISVSKRFFGRYSTSIPSINQGSLCILISQQAAIGAEDIVHPVYAIQAPNVMLCVRNQLELLANIFLPKF